MVHMSSLLSGHDVNWCPGGSGYPAYCPGPSDPDGYNYCCTYFHDGFYRPSCCRFPLHTGVLIALIISAVILCLLFVFLYCWCCSSSRWNRHRYGNVGETVQYRR